MTNSPGGGSSTKPTSAADLAHLVRELDADLDAIREEALRAAESPATDAQAPDDALPAEP